MKLKLIYFFLLYISTIVSQNTIRFNNTYTVSNGSGVSTNVIKYQNKYCLLGVGNNTSNPSQGLRFTKIDSLGNHINTVQIFHPLNYDFTYNSVSNAFIKLDSTKALYTGQVGIAPDYSKATLAKINLSTLDTLWLKSYSQAGDSTWLLCSTVLTDSNIISFGFKYYKAFNNIYLKPFMMKVDKNGNYKWHKYINSSFSNTLYLYQKIIKLSDNDFIVLGNKVLNVCVPQAFSMRIDTNAVKQYEVNFIGIQYPVVNDAIVLQDGNILAVGGYIAVSNCSAVSDKYKKFSYKINPATGAKIISKTYNHQSNATNVTSVQQKTNGLILVGGATTNESTVNSYNYNADILTLNNNLDSLNSIFIDNTGTGFSQQTNQLLLTPDGGFAAAIASYPTAGVAKFWLVKADSNGCYTATCSSVGIKELEILNDKLTLYPNPADGMLNVKWDPSTASGQGMINVNTPIYNLKFIIYNSLQQMIREEEFTFKENIASINTKELQNGVYYLKLKTENGLTISKRFVIAR